MARRQPIEIFMPPNVLKAKVGSMGGSLDVGAMARAEQAMKALKTEFSDWLGGDVARLSEARDRYALLPNIVTRDDLFRAAHDLKGQAATFDFPIIARIAASLTNLFEELRSVQATPLGLVDAHVAAIRVAFRDNVKSADDRVATLLAGELEARVADALASAKKAA